MATESSRRSATTPRWVIALGIAGLLLFVGMVVLHLSGTASMHHGM